VDQTRTRHLRVHREDAFEIARRLARRVQSERRFCFVRRVFFVRVFSLRLREERGGVRDGDARQVDAVRLRDSEQTRARLGERSGTPET
jgi:hypothetical protein